jgi:pimeloyl-ACP methyl ester carboxylesterase
MTLIRLDRPGGALVGTRCGSGPPVLLLHAGGERRTVWKPIADFLAANGHQCVAYDLRGHGDSGATGADELPTHAQDVAAMIAAEPYPLTVVGASLGGLAIVLALELPDVVGKIASVVLVDVVPHLDRDRARAFLGELGHGIADRALVLDILDRRRPQLEAATSGLSDVPTAVVRAERSAFNDEDCAWFSEQVPHAVFTPVAGAGHLVARDAPAVLAEVLQQHLQAAPVRRRRTDWLLERCGVKTVPHPGGTLGAHLDRTADMLAAWNAKSWVVDAGRLHAAYGTNGFPQGFPAVTSTAVRAVAGGEAERLVDLYGRCDRARSYPTLLTDSPSIIDRHTSETHPLSLEQVNAFAELTAANELDVLAHCPSVMAEHGPDLSRLFRRWEPLLSPGARQACAAMSAKVSSVGGAI